MNYKEYPSMTQPKFRGLFWRSLAV